MHGAFAPGLFEQRQNGGGELEIGVVVILMLNAEPSTIAQRCPSASTSWQSSVTVARDSRALGIRLEEQIAAEDLRRLGEVEVLAGHGPGGEAIVADSLDRVGDPHGQAGRRHGSGGVEDGVDQLVAEAGPGSVVDRDVLAFRVDELERAGDGVGRSAPPSITLMFMNATLAR